MILAGCVAETLFTGLGGGGFATVYDAATRQVTCLDFFVAVPGLDGTVPEPARGIKVAFGDVEVPYAVGGPSVAVPGTPRGVAALHQCLRSPAVVRDRLSSKRSGHRWHSLSAAARRAAS